MSWTLQVINSVSTYNISDATLSWIEGYSGLGASPKHIIEERAPAQHGSTYLDYRLDPRVFEVVLGTKATTATLLEANLATLVDYFAGYHGEIHLKWTLHGGGVRQIKCKRIGDLDFPQSDRAGFYQRVGIQFKAANPLFYDPTQVTKVLVTASGATIDGDYAETYAGKAWEHPLVRITGPIDDAWIINETTNEGLCFENVTIPGSGDYYDIDCRFGYKTVKDAAGTNKIADLATGPGDPDKPKNDLATFHMTPGINTFHCEGNTCTSSVTKFSLYYYKRYESLWG